MAATETPEAARRGGPRDAVPGAGAAANIPASIPAAIPAPVPEDDRVTRAIAAEEARRLVLTARVRALALLALAGLVTVVVPWPDVLWIHSGMALFALLGYARPWLARTRAARDWHAYGFTALDMALLTVVLIYPNPITPEPYPPQLALKFNNTVYFFVMIASLCFTFRPLLVLWGGVTAAAFWSLGHVWLISLPDTRMATDRGVEALRARNLDLSPAIEVMMDPYAVDVDLWLQDVVVLLVVSGMLAVAVAGGRALILSQAATERRSAALSRYLPQALAEALAENRGAFVEEREREAAVVFTDVVGFTGWAEGRSAAEVLELLRAVQGVVAEAVFEAGGTLDKFIGDGAMATFGATGPLSQSDVPPARRAQAAFGAVEAVLAGIAALNARRRAEGLEEVRLSAGLHYGPVVVGDVGGTRQLELAVLGDTVNVASRVEALTRPLKVLAAASEEAVAAAGGPRPGWALHGAQAIPGRSSAEVLWVMPLSGAAEPPAAAG